MVPMEGAVSPKVVVRRVDRSMSEHLKKLQGDLILTHCSSPFEVQRTVVTIHLALPMPQKIAQFNKRMRKIRDVLCKGV
jgi:hypothetical protein